MCNESRSTREAAQSFGVSESWVRLTIQVHRETGLLNLLAEQQRTSTISLRTLYKPESRVNMAASSGYTVDHVFLDILVPPLMPTLTRKAGEQFDTWRWRAAFDNVEYLVRLARMLALPRSENVDLRASPLERAHPAANAEQQEFGYVPEVEPDSTAVLFSEASSTQESSKEFVLATSKESNESQIAQHLQLLTDFRFNVLVLRMQPG